MLPEFPSIDFVASQSSPARVLVADDSDGPAFQRRVGSRDDRVLQADAELTVAAYRQVKTFFQDTLYSGLRWCRISLTEAGALVSIRCRIITFNSSIVSSEHHTYRVTLELDCRAG